MYYRYNPLRNSNTLIYSDVWNLILPNSKELLRTGFVATISTPM